MKLHSPKARIGLALIDAALSVKAAAQGAFGQKQKAQKTLRRLLEHRQSWLPADHVSRADAQYTLAQSYYEGNAVDCMQAEALLSDCQFCFVKKLGPYALRVAKALHLRGLVQSRLGDNKRAHAFHQAADIVYAKVRPLSYERIANLHQLGFKQDWLGMRVEAEATRELANQLNKLLAMQSVRRRF
ncbi:hypothetical protein KBI23_02775 [bacterium]|nr:hypothetical protein [bacterium]MBP9808075.1 hypothetical protein [bacterium]